MPEARVVILGAGQAGGRAALTLREAGFDGSVTLVGEEPHPPYERPALSKELLTGAMAPEAIRLAPPTAWAENGIALRCGVAATQIDVAGRFVRLSDGETLGFDHLVIATGAQPRRLDMLADRDGPVSLLRTIDDAQRLRRALGPGRRLAVLGAGVIGLEVAASAAALGAQVSVFEAAAHAMGRAVSPAVAARLARLHGAAGVDLRFGQRLRDVAVSADGVRLAFEAGDDVEADHLLLAIGVAANDTLAAAAGLRTADGIVVDAFGRASAPGVWAIGDVARHPAAWAPGASVRQETWRHAEAHARLVARAITGAAASYQDVPGFWSDQYGHRFQAEGAASGIEVLREVGAGPGFAALYLADDGRVVGCAVLDAPKTAALARRAIAAGRRLDVDAVRDPAGDLNRVLRG